MALHLKLFPAWAELTGTKHELKEIDLELSFKDLTAESQLKRFKSGCYAREKAHKVWEGYDDWKAAKIGQLKENLTVHACKWREETLLVPIGLCHRLLDRGIRWENAREPVTRTLDLPPFDGRIRPYQTRAIQMALSDRNIASGLGITQCATGTGKTVVGQEILRHLAAPGLFIVPSRPILMQTYERFRNSFGRRNVGIYGDGKHQHGNITVATYQSLYSADPEEFDRYSVAIMDEAAHVAAETFFEVSTNRIRNAVYRFGLSADIARADGGEMLVEAAAGPIIFEYPAHQAIKDGYLARPSFMTYVVTTTGGEYKDWKTKTVKGKEVRQFLGMKQAVPINEYSDHACYKNWVLGNDRLNDFVAATCSVNASSNKSVLVLIDEKEHGEVICERLRMMGVDHAFVIGGEDNDAVLESFNQRRTKVLVATSTLGEGADTISVDVLINLMGGKRPKQAVGRALRNDPDPDTGIPRKPTATVIDFDFPTCKVLNSHYNHRHLVYEEYDCGQPTRLMLP